LKRLALALAVAGAVFLVPVPASHAGRQPQAPPPSAQPPYPAFTGALDGNEFALTFDDGPSPYSEGIMKALARYDAPATFCVVGVNAAANPDIVRAEAAAGHEICNHTYHHPDLALETFKTNVVEWRTTSALIRQLIGKRPVFGRAPYGSWLGPTLWAAARVRLRLASGDVSPADWTAPPADVICRRVVDGEPGVTTGVKPGSIVVMHDAGGDRSHTVEALPCILQKLIVERGLRPVTLSEMLGPEMAPRPPRRGYPTKRPIAAP
jgi:peptidoglycan/xylan/chitin deacetylase (PgdA/CDA1 family)